MGGHADGEDYESVAFESGDAVVVRTKDEGCDSCGKVPIGVLIPVADEVAGAYRDGILICEDCYDSEEHYDDNSRFELREF